MFDFDTLFRALPKQKIVCVGDLMLDAFVYGDVRRISPEAPTPVIAVRREDVVIGGAGNVARNVAGLGATARFVGVTGSDADAKICRDECKKLGRAFVPHIVADPARRTTRKLRFVSEQHHAHLLRADWEDAMPLTRAIEKRVLEALSKAVQGAAAIVLSDYAKGVLTPAVIRAAIAHGRRAGIPVVVDPKGPDFSLYKGAGFITPNRKELGEATRMPVCTLAQVERAAASFSAMTGNAAVLITLSEDGMLLYRKGEAATHVAAYQVRVHDVSGAGDTVAAVMALSLAAGADPHSAMRAANAAASVVVGKPGTATLSAQELSARLLPPAALATTSKVADAKTLTRRIAQWRADGLRIGFTNGCFDLIHPGHARLLANARANCDRLLVAINSDASVRRLKGKDRPLQDQDARAQVLAAMEAVDLVATFTEDTPLNIIRRVKPDVLIKGADYTRDQVVGGDFVERGGGEVVLVPIVPNQSTSKIVARSRKKSGR